jgi:hypothetical protein
MLREPSAGLLLVGGIEPTIDALEPEALRTRRAANSSLR